MTATPNAPANKGSDDMTPVLRGPLFQGIAPQDGMAMLGCLGAQMRSFSQQERIISQGDAVRHVGLVLSGQLTTERTDALGNRSILGRLGPGDTFAEAYAAARLPAGVDVVALSDCDVAFIDLDRILNTCSNACGFHTRLIANLFSAIAGRNIALTRKIADISPRTIRGRLTSYLSGQADAQNTAGARNRTGAQGAQGSQGAAGQPKADGEPKRFRIPFTRQQLADYLCVDRSALSHELGKMRAEGIIDFDRDQFWFV